MKYNWTHLKNAFIHGTYRSLKEFGEAKKIPYKTLLGRARGWIEEKQEKDREKNSEISKRLLEKTINREIEREFDRNTDILTAHDRMLMVVNEIPIDKLQRMAIEAPRSFSSLAAALATLQKVHRIAEGLDLPQANGEGKAEEITVIFKDSDE